ncbi:hypothetical protein [Kitasatospora sp. HPMI-4]|uniref:hypothetical protein n=1 Tax=Kitasatospora sp. HPMI-4 TaxID=3448443 RepID=UPI003F1B8307
MAATHRTCRGLLPPAGDGQPLAPRRIFSVCSRPVDRLGAFIAHVTIAHLPDRDTVVADPPDRRSAYWLEQAGFMRDDALQLHRIRRDTDASTTRRQILEAERLVTVAGYGFTRVYSKDEQRRRVEAVPPKLRSDSPEPRTLGDRTVWVHLVSDDLDNGHLVLHAHHRAPEGALEMLVDYPGAGEAAVFYTEPGSRHYGPDRHPSLAAAREAWARLGYEADPPEPGIRRAAARRTSPLLLGRPGPLPPAPPRVATPAPSRTSGSNLSPF